MERSSDGLASGDRFLLPWTDVSRSLSSWWCQSLLRCLSQRVGFSYSPGPDGGLLSDPMAPLLEETIEVPMRVGSSSSLSGCELLTSSLSSPESSRLGCHGSLSRVLTSPVWSTGWFWLLGAGTRTVSPGLSLASSHSGICAMRVGVRLCSFAHCGAPWLVAWRPCHCLITTGNGRSSAGLSCWVSALLSAVSWWYRSSCLAQGCVPLLRPFALLLALWSSVPSGSLLLYIAPSLRDEVTLPGRVCLSPRSQRRLFLHLPGVWSRTFAMRSPLRVESFSGFDRNEDSSRTFPSVLVPSLCDGVALIGPCCVFLHTRSERRLLLPPILYYFAMGSPFGSSVVVLPARSERSLLGIAGRCSFRMGSPFSGPVITTWSRVKEFLELGSWERFSGLFSGWVSSSFDHPVCSEVGEGPTFRCLHLWWGLCLYRSRQQRSGSWTFFFYWPCRLSPSPGGSVCFGSLTVISFTWAFHALALHAWWLASGIPGSRTFQYGLLAYCQGTSESLPHPSTGHEVDASVFWHRGMGVAPGNATYTYHGILPKAGPGIVCLCL